jgi:hypothetical protein
MGCSGGVLGGIFKSIWRIGRTSAVAGRCVNLSESEAVTAAPLDVIEDHLAALLETAELVSPKQEQEFRSQFQTALTAAVDKCDRVVQFPDTSGAADRLCQVRDPSAEAAQSDLLNALWARVEEYVIQTIENLRTDDKR